MTTCRVLYLSESFKRPQICEEISPTEAMSIRTALF